LEWFLTELALLANSLLPFMIGAYFVKYDLLFSVKRLLSKKLNRVNINALMALILVAMFVAKMYFPTLYVAVFTGVGTVVCYLLIDKPAALRKILEFLGVHSANIWLIHMFIYMTFSIFKSYVFYFKNPIAIFSTLLIVCIMFSYLIDNLESLINRMLARSYK
ncbi:hypothetical protein, partial [Endozoicomonas acroporae]|uniref:hypothetical protein n=1 Tax=Endozoicomonas acroporae TaxID=1701104 RepID=UPI003D79A878